MKKLLRGIVEFRKNLRQEYRDTFARLALGQSPDSLFLACSDSRVAANVFASTDPGDLFVVRNVGNLIPPCSEGGISTGDEAEAAAIEFALTELHVSSIIVCGHSECGAMRAALKGRENIEMPNFKSWLRLTDSALDKLESVQQSGSPLCTHAGLPLAPHNVLSQLNVLEQLENLRTYPAVREKVERNALTLHGWWFDIARADLYAYDDEEQDFIIIDEMEASRIMDKVSTIRQSDVPQFSRLR